MVEGSEEVISPSSGLVTEQFETIFCDTTYPDRQENFMDTKSTKQDSNNVS